MDIKDLSTALGQSVTIQGWVRTSRCQGPIAFIEVNDGSCFSSIQVVAERGLANFQEIADLVSGTAVKVEGVVVDGGGRQAYELKATSVEVVGGCDHDYPLQKKRHSFEYLREIAHLRPRANTFRALFRLRSVLSLAIHQFYQERGYVYLHAPLITSNDCEGAGESFEVKVKGEDFFNQPAGLTVSGQLNAEAFALAFGRVYTFGPTFRADRSNTPRHANEFWMVEPETAFTDLSQNMDNIEEAIKYCLAYVKERCPEELAFFNQMIDPTLLSRIDDIISRPFVRMTYTRAIELLRQADVKFVYSDITWGMDLQSEHERYLAETVVGGPLFLTDYPKDIKAFYMKLNDDGKTVAAVDLLVPRIGELVGGSQREDDYQKLLTRTREVGIAAERMEWYLDLRRYGGVPHAGYGIGFDRLLMLVSGIENIRDVIPFPRAGGSLKF